jgi:hypothetical protein
MKRVAENSRVGTMTTLWLPMTDHREIRTFAERRGMRVGRVPRLLLEGWKLLSPEQVAAAAERMERSATRREKQPA